MFEANKTLPNLNVSECFMRIKFILIYEISRTDCVESTSILHRTTESERGLMVGGIYNYLTINNKHMNLSFFS